MQSEASETLQAADASTVRGSQTVCSCWSVTRRWTSSRLDIEPTGRGGERPEELLQESPQEAGGVCRDCCSWAPPAGQRSEERDGVASEEANGELLHCWFLNGVPKNTRSRVSTHSCGGSSGLLRRFLQRLLRPLTATSSRLDVHRRVTDQQLHTVCDPGT
ncbi:hypothetical protein EYF80_054776 [Liparis tanakae]|uniref:Uncharacterized protein n=1 Tax=Liparis tanakae TaxID=230148 RepID=A0A4Z2F1P3_9TELE|nr:hypothetical protein EYF80_054776 [Liparis tanakae]